MGELGVCRAQAETFAPRLRPACTSAPALASVNSSSAALLSRHPPRACLAPAFRAETLGYSSGSVFSSRVHLAHAIESPRVGERLHLDRKCVCEASPHRPSSGDYSGRDGRRKGRPAWTRSPDDTPLRDGNRDRLIGLLTIRAVHTLLHYTMETNQQLHHWIRDFYNQNPIPIKGSWEDVSGDTFLRKLLQSPLAHAGAGNGIDPLYDCCVPIGVDPRSVANRILDIRTILAKEWAEDLKQVTEENGELLKESLLGSLLLSVEEEGGEVGGSMDDGVNTKLQAEWLEREKRIKDGMTEAVEADEEK